MQISFMPQRREDVLSVSKAGDALTINGDQFDFSALPDGATIPAGTIPCEFISGDVNRVNGDLQITLILPHGPNPSQAVAFPQLIANVPDGVVAVPKDPEPELEPSETEESQNVGG